MEPSESPEIEWGLVRRDGRQVDEASSLDTADHVFWKDKEGHLHRIQDMADQHLRNTALMLMGLGYQAYSAPDHLKILWLTTFRMEWKRRMYERRLRSSGREEED